MLREGNKYCWNKRQHQNSLTTCLLDLLSMMLCLKLNLELVRDTHYLVYGHCPQHLMKRCHSRLFELRQLHKDANAEVYEPISLKALCFSCCHAGGCCHLPEDVAGPPGVAGGRGLGPVLLLLRLLPVLWEAHDVSIQGGGPWVQPPSWQGGHPHHNDPNDSDNDDESDHERWGCRVQGSEWRGHQGDPGVPQQVRSQSG